MRHFTASIALAVIVLSAVGCAKKSPCDLVPESKEFKTSFANGAITIDAVERKGPWHLVFPKLEKVYFAGEDNVNILGPFEITKVETTDATLFGNSYFIDLSFTDNAGGSKNNTYTALLSFESRNERNRIAAWLKREGWSGSIDITPLFTDRGTGITEHTCFTIVNNRKLDTKLRKLVNCTGIPCSVR